MVVIGLAWVPSRRVAYDASTAQFTVPGSWMPLALMMGIFFFRYAVAVIHAIRPGSLDTDGTVLLVAGAYGFFSGLFMVHAMDVLVVVRQGGWWRGAPDGARVEST